MSDDRVFKALADPSRRFLLDLLFAREGRTLTELESELEMTRFGVMKHLKVLEDAGLVIARRSGREKLHYLNAVPIRLVHDRWIDKYTERQVSALADLKGTLDYDLRPGGAFRGLASQELKEHGAPDVCADGEILEVDPPRRLVQTWRMLMDDDLAAEGFTKLTYEVEPAGDGVVKLTVTHELDGAPELAKVVSGAMESEGAGGGWARILSDIKTLLETGAPMPRG
nr:metalloregulator ArsR/SmtB family transcription factor [Amycolatopsis suaedae]